MYINNLFSYLSSLKTLYVFLILIERIMIKFITKSQFTSDGIFNDINFTNQCGVLPDHKNDFVNYLNKDHLIHTISLFFIVNSCSI